MVFAALHTSCGKFGGGVPCPVGWQLCVPHGFGSESARALPDESASRRLPPWTFTFGPNEVMMPCWRVFGGTAEEPSARTYFADRTPHFLSLASAFWQRSIALAPWNASLSAIARLSSQSEATLSIWPSQSSSAGS